MKRTLLLITFGLIFRAEVISAMTWDDAISEVPKCKEVVAQAQVLAGEHVNWTNPATAKPVEISCLRSNLFSRQGWPAEPGTEIEGCLSTCGWMNGPCTQRCTYEVRRKCANYETRVVTADFLRDCFFPALKIYTTRTDEFSNLLSSQIHSVENAIPTEIAKQAQEVIKSGSIETLQRNYEELRREMDDLKAVSGAAQKRSE